MARFQIGAFALLLLILALAIGAALLTDARLARLVALSASQEK